MEVPEVKPTLDYNQQLQLVIDRLGGQDALRITRGNSQLLDVIMRVVNKSNSPTACLAKLDEIFRAAKFVAGKMARFKRDGHKVAFDMAATLLEDAHFLLPGHDHPIEKTRLVTILVYDFELLCLIAKWSKVYHQNGGWPKYNFDPVNHPLDREILERLPTMGQYKNTVPESAMASAYQDIVREQFPEKYELIVNWAEGDRDGFRKLGGYAYGLDTCCRSYLYKHVAYIMMMNQAETLSLFPREYQDKIATWQIRIPEAYILHMDIGFHPEALHGKIRQAGVVPSLGLSHGYGAAWVHRERDVVDHYVKSNAPDAFVLQVQRQY